MKTNRTRLAEMTAAEKRDMVRRLLQARATATMEPKTEPAATSTGTPSADQIPAEFQSLDTLPGALQWQRQQDELRRAGIVNPYFRLRESQSGGTMRIDGREYINFSGYNYLGLSGHPLVSTAAKTAIDQYGTSASASRILSGEIPLHRELEREVAALVDAEDAIVFNNGYGTNVGTLAHLFGPKDLIIHDSLIHNSALVGSQLSGARRLPFPHNDFERLDQMLAEHRYRHERTLILVEGVYSMDGDIPDLQRLIEIKQRHKALLMVDEAHSMGVLGPRGFGIGDHFGVDGSAVDLWMGTFSKTFASCGGYIAGAKPVVDYLKRTAPGFVYSCGMSPPDTAAALSAIQILRHEPERAAQLQEQARLFLTLARQRGLNTGTSHGSAVVPVIVGNSVLSLLLAHRLFALGINVHPIMYPAVEENAVRLRFFINILHTQEQIRRTVDAVADNLAALGREPAVRERAFDRHAKAEYIS